MRFLKIHAENVEAPGGLAREMVQIFVSHGKQFLQFVAIDGQVGGLDVEGGAGLYFNKTKDIAVPSDEVEFATAAWGAEIAGHNDVAELAQIEVRRFFSAPPGLMVLSYLFGTTSVFKEPVESLESDFGEEAWHFGPPWRRRRARISALSPGEEGLPPLSRVLL